MEEINNIKKLKKEIDKEKIKKLIQKEKELFSIINPLINSEFETIKKMIKEKDEILQEKLHEFEQIQTNQTNPNFKRLIDKCRALVKENNELYNYIQVGILENLKYENGLTKSQIDQLKLKLKEKEISKIDMV